MVLFENSISSAPDTFPCEGKAFGVVGYKEIPVPAGPTRGRVMAYSAMVGYAVRLVLFSLAAGDDDRGSAKNHHDARDVED